MNRYEKVLGDLEKTGRGELTCHGNSMLPILQNPSTCHYRREDAYVKGDIVLCKVLGRMIDAHKVTSVSRDGDYLISNNRGHDNGWTRQVYGRVVEAYDRTGKLIYTSTD